MNDLLPCPLCGSATGYVLRHGYAWTIRRLVCKSCVRVVADCEAPIPKEIGNPYPASSPEADEAWNDAARYADGLLSRLIDAENALAECANCLPGYYYMDPPDGGDVSIPEQIRRMSEDARKWRATQGDNNG